MAVTRINYIHSRNCRTIGSMIFSIWFISITVSLAPLFGWKDADYERRVNVDQQCIISQDVGYQVFATVMTFYAPLVIILLLYWRIFMTARTRLRKRMAAKANINLHQVSLSLTLLKTDVWFPVDYDPITGAVEKYREIIPGPYSIIWGIIAEGLKTKI